MDDSKLLELASLAAGEKYTREHNPLERDDLALRLAVRLNRTDIGALIMNYTTGAEYRDCPYTATRRAIVRAAAEIGKGMK